MILLGYGYSQINTGCVGWGGGETSQFGIGTILLNISLHGLDEVSMQNMGVSFGYIRLVLFND